MHPTHLICISLAALLMSAFASGAQQAAPHCRDHARLLYYLDGAGHEHPVATAEDWERRKADILAGMQEVMGPFPGPERKVALDVRVEEEVPTGNLRRRKITYAPEA